MENITEWCISGKCDMLIIQWYTWYIALYTKFIALFYWFKLQQDLCSIFIDSDSNSYTCLCQVLLAQVGNFLTICSFSFYTYAYYLFISSKIKWQFVLHFVSEHVCTFKYMSSFVEPLGFICWIRDNYLCSILFMILRRVSFFFFVYGLLLPKDKMISFFANSMYCILFLVMWISCTKSLL